MSIFDKVGRKFGLMENNEQENQYDDTGVDYNSRDIYNTERDKDMSAEVVSFRDAMQSRDNNVISTKVRMMVIEPKSFDDAQQVANCLREKKPVVINFENTDSQDAHRIIDFISGTTYALNGEIKKVGANVFLCVPSNVNVSFGDDEHHVSNDMPWLRK